MPLALIVSGYVLAVPFTVFTPGFKRLWRKRERWVFATEQTGAVLLAVGYGLKGSPVGALVNGGWAAGLAVAYVAEGRRRARAASESRS